MAHLRRRGGAGGGSGAGLVGKQAPLHAVHQHGAKAAGHRLPQAEGLLEDPLKNRRQQRRVFQNQHDGHEEVAPGHDGHQHIQHLHGGVFPENDDRRQSHQHHRGVNRRDAEGVFKGGGDGVADDLADAAPAGEAGQGEQHGGDAAAGAAPPPGGEVVVDVVGGAAPVAAVEGVRLFVELCQGGLDEGGGGANEGGQPHPEHRSGAAGGDGRHHADEVAHAHPGGGGDDEGLPAGDGAAVSAALFRRHPQHFGKQADWQKAGAEREIDAGGDEQQYQQGKAHAPAAGQGQRDEITPQKSADGGDQVYDDMHVKGPPEIVMRRKASAGMGQIRGLCSFKAANMWDMVLLYYAGHGDSTSFSI